MCMKTPLANVCCSLPMYVNGVDSTIFIAKLFCVYSMDFYKKYVRQIYMI